MTRESRAKHSSPARKVAQGTHCTQVDSKQKQEKITEPTELVPKPYSFTFAGYREGRESGVTSTARNFPVKQKKEMHIANRPQAVTEARTSAWCWVHGRLTEIPGPLVVRRYTRILKRMYFYLYACMFVCADVSYMCAGACGRQKKPTDPWSRSQLQAVGNCPKLQVLGTKVKSSGGAAGRALIQ